jgi:UDP-glucose 4-epimerase
MNAREVVVTGAHGFIGRHVARGFARQGYTVTGIGHGRWAADEWRSWGLTDWWESDISTAVLDERAGKPEVLVHCAGSGSVALSFADPLTDFQRTVTTTVNVMDFVRRKSPSTRIVYPSSASVYGVVAEIPITEEVPCTPISPYGMHKWIAERIIASYCRHFSISASIVRLFSVYGCGLRKQLLWDGCRKLTAGDGLFAGTGEEVRDWLHIDDAVELMRVAVEHSNSACPVANGGTGQGVSVREMLMQLTSCLNVDSSLVKFSDNTRAGDPTVYVADVTRAAQWGWGPGQHWHERVAEYAEWWKLEMGIDQSPGYTRADAGNDYT